MNKNRREFIKKAALLSVAPIAFGLGGCTKNGESPFTSYSIDADVCIGCGECSEACVFDSISLPRKSEYWIDTDECIECGQCLEYCEYNAIKISVIEYNFDTEKCVGCGDCIDVCVNEGNCISYEKEDYSVRGKCHPNQCHLQCVAACPEGAITVGERAVIDLDKCTKCGDCVDVCPRDAINPAKVVKNDADCNHCGKCFEKCEFDVITKSQPQEDIAPHIDMDLCERCGECRTACEEYDAIKWELFTADIIRRTCRDCGDCLDACQYDAVIETIM